MKTEYDFSVAKRGPVFPPEPGKTSRRCEPLKPDPRGVVRTHRHDPLEPLESTLRRVIGDELPEAASLTPRPPVPTLRYSEDLSNFDQLRRIVVTDGDLMSAFTAAATAEQLYSMVIALGRERGLEVTAAELDAVARANRREFFERWLPQ